MEDECWRCGEWAEGKWGWMFHQGEPAYEFYCRRCRRVFRVYAAIGFTLLGLLLLAGGVAVVWLRWRAGL